MPTSSSPRSAASLLLADLSFDGPAGPARGAVGDRRRGHRLGVARRAGAVGDSRIGRADGVPGFGSRWSGPERWATPKSRHRIGTESAAQHRVGVASPGDGPTPLTHHVRLDGPRSRSPAAGTSRASSSSSPAVQVATSSASAKCPHGSRRRSHASCARRPRASRRGRRRGGGRRTAGRRPGGAPPSRPARPPERWATSARWSVANSPIGRPARRRRRRCRGVPTSHGPTLPGRRRSPRPDRTDVPWPAPALGCARSAHRRGVSRTGRRLVRRVAPTAPGRRRRGNRTVGATGSPGGCACPASSRRPGGGRRAPRVATRPGTVWTSAAVWRRSPRPNGVTASTSDPPAARLLGLPNSTRKVKCVSERARTP